MLLVARIFLAPRPKIKTLVVLVVGSFLAPMVVLAVRSFCAPHASSKTARSLHAPHASNVCARTMCAPCKNQKVGGQRDKSLSFSVTPISAESSVRGESIPSPIAPIDVLESRTVDIALYSSEL